MEISQYLPIILNDLKQLSATLENPLKQALLQRSPTALAQVQAQLAAIESLANEAQAATGEQIRAWTPPARLS